MKCPHCKSEMTELFTSYVCDLCEPPKKPKRVIIEPEKPPRRDDTQPLGKPYFDFKMSASQPVEAVYEMHSCECDCVRCGMWDYQKWTSSRT